MSSLSAVDPNNAGKGAYGQLVQAIAQTGKCPFCPGEFEKYNPPPLLTCNGWFAAKSLRPYRNTTHHFVLISVEHKETLADLTPEDLQALQYLRQWLVDTYQLKGFVYFMRVGDMRYTCASVQHLHEHLVVCDVDKPWPIWTLGYWFPRLRAVLPQFGNPAAKS